MSRFLSLGLVLAVVGCSGANGPTVTGQVTYGGQPLANGMITFEPDTEAGQRGPAVSAMIVNGKYKTPADRGFCGGACVIRVDPPEIGSGTPEEQWGLVFPAHTVRRERPTQSSTLDIDVPASK